VVKEQVLPRDKWRAKFEQNYLMKKILFQASQVKGTVKYFQRAKGFGYLTRFVITFLPIDFFY
jgi:hypothetical protein